MKKTLLMGMERHMVPIPRLVWQKQVTDGAKSTKERIDQLTANEHRVRDYVVKKIPLQGLPLSPDSIAQALSMSVEGVNTILDELEKGLTFLYRTDGINVDWAYPVTVDVTPHTARLDNGKQFNSA